MVGYHHDFLLPLNLDHGAEGGTVTQSGSPGAPVLLGGRGEEEKEEMAQVCTAHAGFL